MKDLYDIRKKLHRVPEIAFNEFKTQEIILNEFKGISDFKLTKFDPTGLLYEYSFGDGEYILFRADMDALPLTEETGCDFKSEHTGTFHACGHDIHMTVLIGLMKHVLETKPKLNLLFLYQPAEEGHGGAKHIINTGIFKLYKIKSAYALHVSGQFPTGTIGIKPGIVLGIPQEFNIEFHGEAGHVATPQKGKDAFRAAMSFYQEMNTILCKRFPAQEPVIFHIGKVTAGTVRNITPDYCRFEGTFRCLKQEVKEKIVKIMRAVCKSIETSHEVKVNIKLLSSYVPVINDENLTKAFIERVPKDVKVVNVEYSMVGEDFGFFTNMYRSVFFWLGADAKGDLHSTTFLPDEKCIDMGVRVLTQLIIDS